LGKARTLDHHKTATGRGSYPCEKEKRGRRLSPYHHDAKHLCGVLRFDGHLTGAIYVLKSTGKVISANRSSSNSTASLERR